MNVDIIIKNAKTIAEFKETRERMKQLTEKCYSKHKHICIEYESGKFWHYSDEGEVLSWD